MGTVHNNECENIFWGPFCNQSCSKDCLDDGVTSVCDRYKGTCKHGCIDACATSELTNSTNCEAEKNGNDASEENSDGNNKNIIFYLLGIGTAVVVIAAASLLYFIRRK